MIELRSINKVYSTRNTDTLALENINMQVSKGEFVAVMGPSGCGKSTLLNLLGLLDNPTSGEYFLMGKEVSGLSEAELSEIRKQNIGFIFQNFNLVDDLTVEENIELALLYRKMPRKEKNERIQHAMEQMQLSHRAKHFPIQLSG
ncbi:MAG: ATP-binding cassette domain-containing protein, partial [Kangiellaceae bacterium]|nr:ATP-binding cassette domain-containing protein [Kangiellaceae bacterium]